MLDRLQNEESTFKLIMPDSDHLPSLDIVEEQVREDGKIHRVFEDGRREVIFPNGVKREIWPDGYQLVHFTNGDVKQTFPAGSRSLYG